MKIGNYSGRVPNIDESHLQAYFFRKIELEGKKYGLMRNDILSGDEEVYSTIRKLSLIRSTISWAISGHVTSKNSKMASRNSLAV